MIETAHAEARGQGKGTRERPGRVERGAALAREILRSANRGLSRIEFLREVSNLLMEGCGCDAIEVWVWKSDLRYRWGVAHRPNAEARFELTHREAGSDPLVPDPQGGSDLERLCVAVACQRLEALPPVVTRTGSFWTGDAWEPLCSQAGGGAEGIPAGLCLGGHHRSLAVVRFVVDEDSVGLLHLKREAPNAFSREDVAFFEEAAQELGLGIAAWRAQAALRERIKELTCLYGIAQVMEEPGVSFEESLGRIVRLLPPAWQHPDNAAARIDLDGHVSESPGYRSSRFRQTAEICGPGRRWGSVEVVYLDDSPELTGRAFLPEERHLIEAVARQLALLAERQQTEREKAALQQQLIHADRLATIGQLAAGVAHELNEPLGNILGYAQLIQKCADLPGQASRDVERIVTASLYAREVIKKLMVFARQVPARKTRVALIQVVEEALYFLEARCAKAGVEVERRFAPPGAEIIADPAQLKQVVVNLVVNAIQAMPAGGLLTVGTRTDGEEAVLEVSDTGAGMGPEVLERAFLPFFTTKDVHEGTGLGLAVVHGIVTAHGGSIRVESEPGRGARFEVRLPVDEPAGAQEAEHVERES